LSSVSSTVTYTSVDIDSVPGKPVFPADEQPLPPVDSPTALSPGYMADSDPEEDPEEDPKEDPEEDL
ncbi:hypothetical protein Tco_0871304, partial [Tanacetum coccineum]